MKSIKDWWKGTLISQYSFPEGDVDLFPPFYKRPRMARVWERGKAFWFTHWKWILSSTIILVLGIIGLLAR